MCVAGKISAVLHIRFWKGIRFGPFGAEDNTVHNHDLGSFHNIFHPISLSERFSTLQTISPSFLITERSTLVCWESSIRLRLWDMLPAFLICVQFVLPKCFYLRVKKSTQEPTRPSLDFCSFSVKMQWVQPSKATILSKLNSCSPFPSGSTWSG